MRAVERKENERKPAATFPPCVICGERHDWRKCYAKQKRERQKRKTAAPQRGGDPAGVGDVLLNHPALPEDLRMRLKAKREERKDGK